MQNYKLILEYDGTNYCGFQVQAHEKTIQAELEAALEKLFQKKIRIISCGRTDSGVHALCHVVNFKVATMLKNRNIQDGLNRYLPRDIAVLSVAKAPETFHARYGAKKKTYAYRILTRPVRSPLRQRYAVHTIYPLNVARMRKALKLLEGRHDFRSFASKMPKEKNTVRTMHRAAIRATGDELVISLTANGFLYNMVRNIVGTVCLVGRGKMTIEEFVQAFRKKNRIVAGPTAPAHGLCLMKVRY